MMSKLWFSAAVAGLLSLSVQTGQAQNDPVLFSLKDTEVRVSEFKYIYSKTSGDKAAYTKQSLDEYLRLYIDFKLQLLEGREQGLDKDPNVRREQEQYRQSLAETYLTEREITEKLVKEAYERSKEDRRIAHILVTIPLDAPADLEAAVKERVEKIGRELTAENFDKLAAQYSEDSYSRDKGGDLGFYTALQLPSYELENTVYQTGKGAVSKPVRTKYGYHFVKVTDVRPALGKVQAAHIFVRPGDENKKLIDSLYEVLKKEPNKFNELAGNFSQDNLSRRNDGLLGWVAINQYESGLENAIFGLKRDGDIAAPFQSSSGWHILRRIKTLKSPNFSEVKAEITAAVKRDVRYELVQNALVARIQKEGNYKANTENMQAMMSELEKESTFLAYSWKPTEANLQDNRILFSLGENFRVYVKDFMQEAQRATQERFIDQPKSVRAAADKILNKLIVQRCIQFETAQLEGKYSDFSNLLREYQEGILLFEVKKKFIWDLASADEEGLKSFYEANSKKYQWKQRARITQYMIRSTEAKLVNQVRKASGKKTPEQLMADFNKDQPVLQFKANVYEKGASPQIDAALPKWKAKALSANTEKDGMTSFYKIEEILPAGVKTLAEARGMVVADYQEKLEKEFIAKLREKYPVKINQEVLESLIKK